MEGAGPLLSVEAIDVFYGDVQALWSVSFQVQNGEIVALIGSNGAGKTTSLRTISGLLRPASGRIRFAGAEIQEMAAHAIVHLGMAQIPEGRKIWPTMNVQENLELGSYGPQARASRRQNLQRVFALFPQLAERRRQAAGTLSGGEQQMLAIGRGLMANPRLLMLDEPSLGLAPIVVEELFELIRSINSLGMTILLIEQNVLQALEIAARAYVLETGRIVAEGPAHDLREDPSIQAAYFGL